MEAIRICMLGEFSLQYGDRIIADSSNRSKKLWILLAYLLCKRDRVIPHDKIIDILWSEDSGSSRPKNALRITLHRLRSLLDGLWPDAGHDLILSHNGSCRWNGNFPVQMDYELFERLCQSHPENEEQLLCDRLKALELYKGEFLSKFSSELWIIPLSAHLHNLFVQASMEAAMLLSARGRHEEAAHCCRRALAMEPYDETLAQLLMLELCRIGERDAAAEVYDALSQRLFTDFGIEPSEEIKKLYRCEILSPVHSTLPVELVFEQLKEKEAAPGALQCDYDYFKFLCQAESRSGRGSHVALISLNAAPFKSLSRKNLDRLMELLAEKIRTGLQPADVFSKCSISQYIIMLSGSGYEDSCEICRRCLENFHRSNTKAEVEIKVSVRPLEPFSKL
ncbi:MAG: hypothetical protein IJE09_07440 [Oscillospiraceae bacterium]|nr:hypothetical protein [Oscillospiraceae bacterium]